MRHPDDLPLQHHVKHAVAAPVGQDRRSSLLWLTLATVVTLILMAVPFASVVTFPIRTFVTFIHEGCHALAALLSGFYVIRMTVHWDGSGLTLTSGQNAFVTSAGYLGTTLFGAFLLYQAQHRNRANVLLIGSGMLVLLLTILFVNGQASWLMMLPLAMAGTLLLGGLRTSLPMPLRWSMLGAGGLLVLLLSVVCIMTGTLYSWVSGLSIGLGLIALGVFTKPHWGQFVANFLAVQCCLNAMLDLKTLFFISTLTGIQSDAATMAQMTGIPAFFWASAWLASGILLLGVTLWFLFQRPARTRSAASYAKPAAAK